MASYRTVEELLAQIIARLTIEKERAEEAADRRRLEAIEAAEARRQTACMRCADETANANQAARKARQDAAGEFTRRLAQELLSLVPSTQKDAS